MSSSDPFRIDPFAQPFASTGGNPTRQPAASPTAKRALRRPLLLFFVMTAAVIGCMAVFYFPTLAAMWRLSEVQGKIADRQEESAVADLDKAIEAAPEELQLRIARLRLVSRLGDAAKAKTDLDAIEKVFAAFAQPLSRAQLEGRSTLRHMGGAYRKALEDQTAIIKEVIDAKPPPAVEAQALNNHAYSVGLAVDKEPQDNSADQEALKAALEDCNRSLKLSPDQSSTLDTRGYIHTLLGDTESAIADLNRSLELVVRDLQHAKSEVNGDTRQLSKKLVLREIEHGVAVIYQHRMNAHQKAGNEEAAQKDRQAIIDLGYSPDVFLK